MTKTTRTGNTKVYSLIIDSITKSNMSASEINIFLYLALRQDPFGNVEGCYYKDVSLAEGFSKTTYYKSINSLENKGYIRIVRRNKDSLDVQILNNEFKDKKDDKKGYLNIKRKILHSWEFKKLKANEMKIILKLFLNNNLHKNGFKVYPKTIASWLGIKSKSMAIIYKYCENINAFFPNYRAKGKNSDLIIFTTTPEETLELLDKSDKEIFYTYKVKNFCRIYKINYTLKDLKDLIILISQYSKKGTGKLFSVINKALIAKKSIEPRLINFILNKGVNFASEEELVCMESTTEIGRTVLYSEDDLEKIAEKKRRKHLEKITKQI